MNYSSYLFNCFILFSCFHPFFLPLSWCWWHLSYSFNLMNYEVLNCFSLSSKWHLFFFCKVVLLSELKWSFNKYIFPVFIFLIFFATAVQRWPWAWPNAEGKSKMGWPDGAFSQGSFIINILTCLFLLKHLRRMEFAWLAFIIAAILWLHCNIVNISLKIFRKSSWSLFCQILVMMRRWKNLASSSLRRSLPIAGSREG